MYVATMEYFHDLRTIIIGTLLLRSISMLLGLSSSLLFVLPSQIMSLLFKLFHSCSPCCVLTYTTVKSQNEEIDSCQVKLCSSCVPHTLQALLVFILHFQTRTNLNQKASKCMHMQGCSVLHVAITVIATSLGILMLLQQILFYCSTLLADVEVVAVSLTFSSSLNCSLYTVCSARQRS